MISLTALLPSRRTQVRILKKKTTDDDEWKGRKLG